MEKIKKAFRSVASRNGTYSVGLVVLVIAIVIVINMAVGQLPEKIRNIDISENNLYEISDISREMLDGLDKKVEVKVIAQLDAVDNRIDTFVKKYAALSDKIEVEWIDSVLHPSVLEEYDTKGDVIIVSCEETQKQMSIPFSDIIKYNEYSYYMTGQMSETEFDAEGQLTSAIHYVTSEQTKKIYRTSGHGEGTFSTSVNELFTKNNLETAEINLSMDAQIPEDCDLLFLYAPTSDLTDDEKNVISNYLGDGGNVYLILGNTTEEMPNLDGLMKEYGLQKVEGYIADMQRCYQGNYYAIFPELSLSEGQASGIENEMVMLLNSQGMVQTEIDSETLYVEPFMMTSANAYAVTEEEQVKGQYILGAVATNKVKRDDEESEDSAETQEARLTVLASDSMITSDIIEQLTTLENTTLFLNTITDHFDGVENVAVEPKSLTVERNTPIYAGGISFVIIFILPITIVLVGFSHWMKRRKA